VANKFYQNLSAVDKIFRFISVGGQGNSGISRLKRLGEKTSIPLLN
jgi:hypothetical protein